MLYTTFKRFAHIAQEVISIAIIALVVALTVWIVLDTIHEAEAQHAAPQVQGRMLYTYDSKTTKWLVDGVHDGVTHISCEARRKLTKGVTVWLSMDDKGVVVATLDGVAFGETNDSFGLVRIDDKAPSQVYIKTVSAFVTQFTPPRDDVFLKNISAGAKITVLVGRMKYDFDLTETSKVIKELSACNAQGQDHINKLRIDLATYAKERVTL